MPDQSGRVLSFGEQEGEVYFGDCRAMLAGLATESVALVVTSPPYNIGKEYEQRQSLAAYLGQMRDVLADIERVLRPGGSVCWQVGNYVRDGEVHPLDVYFFPMLLDLGLIPRNRIVWTFEHGLHASQRFSGRHETVLWFSKGAPTFDLDPVRVPQKYPQKKHYKGPKKGLLSGNPLGKNPGDVWAIPNVKHNHIEKTAHPCQFPIELPERFVRSLTSPGELVVDPFGGTGTTVVAAVINDRRGLMAETSLPYVEIARKRIVQAHAGVVPMRAPARTPSSRDEEGDDE